MVDHTTQIHELELGMERRDRLLALGDETSTYRDGDRRSTIGRVKLLSYNLKTLLDRLPRHDEACRDLAIREPVRYELKKRALGSRRRAARARAEHVGCSSAFYQRHQPT